MGLDLRAGRLTLSTEEGKVDALERFQQPPLRVGVNHSKVTKTGVFLNLSPPTFREEIRI